MTKAQNSICMPWFCAKATRRKMSRKFTGRDDACQSQESVLWGPMVCTTAIGCIMAWAADMGFKSPTWNPMRPETVTQRQARGWIYVGLASSLLLSWAFARPIQLSFRWDVSTWLAVARMRSLLESWKAYSYVRMLCRTHE